MPLEFEKETVVEDVDYLEEGADDDAPEEEESNEPWSSLAEDSEENEEEESEDPFETDLFGEPIATKPKKAAIAPSAVAKKPEKKDMLYDTEWLIFYAGHRLTVPEDGLLLDQVRSYLELEFPELSKERTEMLTDVDKKHIIPVVKGAKKG